MSSSSQAVLPPGPVMVDVQGMVLTDQERERLRHPPVGGMVLFSPNFEDRAQPTARCQSIRDARDEPLLIAVHHEGGRVQRVPEDGFTTLPAMSQLAQLWTRAAVK